ncbi:MAG TPA: DUF3830 family protein [Chloroflexota bacterium]|nr:DUF3830 family protein [Chloroflexota bacterium]
MLRVRIGPLSLGALFEEERAPKSCAAIRRILPITGKLIQARWSGEAAWLPMGDRRIGLDYENHTSFPGPGELLVYPGGISEMEILVPYGACIFASKVGQLAGNHFATIAAEDRELLKQVGRLVVWEGAQDFALELA